MFVFVKEISSSKISGFQHVVAEIYVLLGYYAVSSGNFHCLLLKSLTLRLLMSYIYGAPILDVSRSHTTTHHSR